MIAIQTDGLSKTYRGGLFRRDQVRALDGLSFSVDSGQIFGLLGPNGAGKTTFVKILLSLTHRTEGEATLLDTPLPDVGVRRRVGYLPENHRYPGYLTGDQVLNYFGRLSGVPRTALATRIPSLLDLVGMTKWRQMKVKKYSKGMLQRIGLAQALINDPEVIFLDEPTDGVDPVGRKEIRDILTELKRNGKTIFLNSHLLSEVELISDRVAILDKGKLLRIGTVEELTAGGSVYTIGVLGSIPDAAQIEARARVLALDSIADGISVECTSVDALNAVIDLLRKHGVSITSVVKQKNSLEDSFISLIKRETTS
jgi:ABC-2 type transport system ATP-binding protein